MHNKNSLEGTNLCKNIIVQITIYYFNDLWKTFVNKIESLTLFFSVISDHLLSIIYVYCTTETNYLFVSLTMTANYMNKLAS